MKHLVLVTGGLALALAGTGVYLARQLGAERARAEHAESRVAQLEARIRSFERHSEPTASAPAPVRNARTGSASSDTAPAQSPPAADASASGTPPQRTWGDSWSRMLADPSSRQLVRGQKMAELKAQTPDLARRLNMTEAEYQKFIDFLVDQDLARNTTFAARRNNSATDFQKLRDQQNKALEAFLGEERARQYAQYKEGEPDRAQVRMLRGRLGEADVLSDDQVERLASGLQEERQSYNKELEARFGGSATYSMGAFFGAHFMASGTKADEDAMEADIVDQMNSYRNRMRDRAGSILTPHQLDVYTEMLDGQLASQRVFLRRQRETPPRSAADSRAKSP
jgi:hypothetical protein